MTCLSGATPAGAGGLDRPSIVAVEKIRASGKGPDVPSLDAVDEYQHRGAVGILARVGEPDRLHSGVPVAR